VGFALRRAVACLRGGGIVAYPTEAVYGLGCDPLQGQAVARLLALKGRAAQRGLILIADRLEALERFVILPPGEAGARVRASWPGPVTWILPARAGVPWWLRGPRPGLAVRVTAHPPAAALARAFGGALVSTSANRSGRAPARSALAVRRQLGAGVDLVLSGPLGGRRRPSEIRDAISGQVVRRG